MKVQQSFNVFRRFAIWEGLYAVPAHFFGGAGISIKTCMTIEHGCGLCWLAVEKTMVAGGFSPAMETANVVGIGWPTLETD